MVSPEEDPRRAGGGPLWPDIVAWALVVPLVLFTAMRLFGLERGYPLVPLVSWTPLAVLGGVSVALACAILRRRVPTAVAATCALALAILVAPRVVPNEPGPHRGPTFRVLASNIHQGGADLGRIVDLVRSEDVDILALSEVEPATPVRLQRLGLGKVLPYSDITHLGQPRPGGAIFSRFPLTPEPPLTRPLTPRALIEAGPLELDFTAVHTYAPMRSAIPAWAESLGKLPAANEPGTQLLAGDFNATLDHAELRDVIGTGYRDAAEQRGGGLTPTWPEGRLFPPGVTIDHVLADDGLEILDYRTFTVPGTDHRAVYAELARTAPDG